MSEASFDPQFPNQLRGKAVNDALCATLTELGVRHVFGLPGTQTPLALQVSSGPKKQPR